MCPEILQIFIMKFYGETHFDCHEHYPPITLENWTMQKKEERGQLLLYVQFNGMRTAWNNAKVNNCLLNLLSFDGKICHALCLAIKIFILNKSCFIQAYFTMLGKWKSHDKFCKNTKSTEKAICSILKNQETCLF